MVILVSLLEVGEQENLVKDVEYLLTVKFGSIPSSDYIERDENASTDQRPEMTSFSGHSQNTNLVEDVDCLLPGRFPRIQLVVVEQKYI